MREQHRKEATIEAIKKLIYKYKYPGFYHGTFLNPKICPLCIIHKKENTNMCRGCPLASVSGAIGCIEFNSFKYLVEHRYDDLYHNALYKRGQFFEIVLPIIENYSMEYFTEMGWQYFGELSRAL